MRVARESCLDVTTAAQPWPVADRAPTAATQTAPESAQLLVSTYRGQYRNLCRLAFLIVDDQTVAEDLVQEAFLRTFAGWRRIRQPELVHLYLRRAVVNLSKSALRSRGNERRANARFSASHSDFWMVEPEPADHVLQAVRGLPQRQRLAVVLRYYADLPEAEIALTLETSIGTVKSQLSKARHNLERALADRTDG